MTENARPAGLRPLKRLVGLLLLGLGAAGCSEGADAGDAADAAEVPRGAPLFDAEQASPQAAAPQPGEPIPGAEGAVASGGVVPEHMTAAGHRAGVFTPLDDLPELVEKDGVTKVSMGHLAFPSYRPPDPRGGEEADSREVAFPGHIQALDGKRVSVRGFMIPIEFEEDKVRTFILTSNVLSCCFGAMPAMDEWVDVEVVADEGANYVNFRVIEVEGTLHVGEQIDDYGYVLCIYRLEADKVTELH